MKEGLKDDDTDPLQSKEISPTDLATQLEAVATAAHAPVMLQTRISDYGYRDAIDFVQCQELQGAN